MFKNALLNLTEFSASTIHKSMRIADAGWSSVGCMVERELGLFDPVSNPSYCNFSKNTN
uniref:DNA (cytosine-5-)-methyltransferase n=1 Tax=Heterorhabditis bacteriophora TaxID=37862 RepID=A0A1I7WU25_HETBA